MLKTLASTAVILSLAACDADSLSSLQSDIASADGADLNLSTNDDGDIVISLNDDGDDGDTDSDSAAGSFQVTFTNLTQNQPMTPPVVALHDPDVHLFQIGEVASDAIQVIAEMGKSALQVLQVMLHSELASQFLSTLLLQRQVRFSALST